MLEKFDHEAGVAPVSGKRSEASMEIRKLEEKSVKDWILEHFNHYYCIHFNILFITVCTDINNCCVQRSSITRPSYTVHNHRKLTVQASGRAGRDGKRYSTKHMIDYCNNTTSCRRSLLFRDFDDCDFSNCKGYKCYTSQHQMAHPSR